MLTRIIDSVNEPRWAVGTANLCLLLEIDVKGTSISDEEFLLLSNLFWRKHVCLPLP
jgi:hypothetical protein